MKNPARILPTGLALILFLCPLLLKGQGVQSSQNSEKILEEFFNLNPSKEKLLAVLKRGAVEPFKTRIIEKIMAQKPTPEEASEVLAQKPPEPYAQQAWKIVESDGTLRNRCYVLNFAPQEYQDKAFASIRRRSLIIYEYIFYVMQGAPQRFVRQIWDDFLKLNPTKGDILTAAMNTRDDFQELSILYSLYQELTVSELDSVLGLIPEIEEGWAKEREEGLIEIMTRK